MRGILHVILEAGYSPMKFFAKDYKKYFYLAELCSLVDLSAVSPPPESFSGLLSHFALLRYQDKECLNVSTRFMGGAQMVKMGVQYSLWGGSVVNLGTERHHAKYFDDIDTFRLPGMCNGPV